MEKGRQSFLNVVRDQIKSKEAKDFVSVELDHHIKEAKNKWMEKGIDEIEAEEKAVGQMGSPIALGRQLNKLHRPKVDWLTVMLLVMAFGLGFIPVLFVDSDYSSRLGLDISYFSKNKLIFSVLGGAVALGMMLIDYRKLAKGGWLFYGIAIFILFLMSLNPYLSIATTIGQFRIEYLMTIPFFLLAWAYFFYDKQLKTWQLSSLFILSFYLFFKASAILPTLIYTVMVFMMLWWSRWSRKTLVITTSVMASSILLMGFFVWRFGIYSLESRFTAFLNPEKDPMGNGYMTLLIKDRMSQAGWFGNALHSESIPDAHTNLVFVGFTYYYGWLAALALVCILALFVVRIMVIARKIHEPYGKLLLIGAVTLYTIQLVSNIAMAVGLFPITAVSLPFISYGIMPTLFNAFLIGVVLSVYRRKDLMPRRSIQPQS